MGSYSDFILARSPAAYYRMDDTTATMTDISGNARDGTWGKVPTLSPSLVGGDDPGVGMTSGWVGSAAYGASAAGWGEAGEWTVEGWMSIAGSMVGQLRIASRFSMQGGTNWIAQTNNANVGLFCSNTNYAYTSNNPIIPNRAYHVAVRRSPAGFDLFLDGARVVRISPPSVGAGTKFQIGSCVYGGGDFTGTLDEFACYSVALTDEAILESYTRGNATPTTTPFSGWGLPI